MFRCFYSALNGVQGPINCIDDHDVTKDDVADLLIARNDGIVHVRGERSRGDDDDCFIYFILTQIYGFDMGPTPTLQYEASISESCQTLCAGVVASQVRVLLHTGQHLATPDKYLTH